MANEYRGYCSLIISGTDLDSDSIEQNLNLKATQKYEHIEILDREAGGSRTEILQFSQMVDDKTSPETALDVLLNSILPAKEFVQELTASADVYLRCYIQSDYARLRWRFSSAVLQKAADLGIEMETSVLSWGGPEEAEEEAEE